jgi:hypothetical protein
MSKEGGQVIIDGDVYYDAMKQKQQKETDSVLDKQIQKMIEQIMQMKKNNIIQDNTDIQKKLEKTQQKLDELVQDKVVVLDKQIKTLQANLEKPNVQNRQETVKQIQKLQGEKILVRLQSKVGEKLDNVPPLLLQAYKDTLNLKQDELHAVETEKRKEKDPERRKKLEKELERLKKELVALYNELLKKIKSSGSWFSNLWKPKPKPVKPLNIQVVRKLQAVSQDLRKTQQQLQNYEARVVDPADLMPTTPAQQQQINKKLTQLRNKISTLKQTKQELQKEKLKEQKQLQKGIKRTLEPLTRPKFTMPTVSAPTVPTLSPDTLRSLNRLVSKFSRSTQEKPYTEKELISKIRQQLQELKSIKQNIKTFSPEETEKIVKEQQRYRKDIMDLITLIGEKKQVIKQTRNIDYLDEIIVNLTTILNKFNKQRQTSTQNVQTLLLTAQLPPQTRQEQKTQTSFQQESQQQKKKLPQNNNRKSLNN